MDEQKFVKLCKEEVVAYANKESEEAREVALTIDDVRVVWLCKALQNNKALLITNPTSDMYYEVTYNGDKNEMYLDVYKKLHNRCIHL